MGTTLRYSFSVIPRPWPYYIWDSKRTGIQQIEIFLISLSTVYEWNAKKGGKLSVFNCGSVSQDEEKQEEDDQEEENDEKKGIDSPDITLKEISCLWEVWQTW